MSLHIVAEKGMRWLLEQVEHGHSLNRTTSRQKEYQFQCGHPIRHAFDGG